ncbi:helix-turn-helix domain-containing protein [Octadecabacter arcticus]|uniref:helix-turn-helix domain-containing protein n=1 Tax=Octadecabacter arcticus TaxID=53946 RepID=UPI0005C46224|nr:helix-turn-helix domain-containing protein [Octadecabacter arcticus]
MISTPDRQTAVALINEAVTAGARRAKACSELEISERTLRRWTKDGEVRPDQRPLVPRAEPANALSAAERAAVLDVCNSKEFSSLPPSQIVPKLADRGQYLASESSFYRILRANGLQHHRGRAKSPVKRKKPTVFVKGVVRRFHAASLISEALISFSGFSQTGPAGCQFRVFPDQRFGLCAL